MWLSQLRGFAAAAVAGGGEVAVEVDERRDEEAEAGGELDALALPAALVDEAFLSAAFLAAAIFFASASETAGIDWAWRDWV